MSDVTIDPDDVTAAWERIASAMDAGGAAELNALDGAMGDGDLGVTMQRGARLVCQALAETPSDMGLAFARCAQAFTKTSGSSFGTLLATGLLAAARPVKGRDRVRADELPDLVRTAVDAMTARGKASLGDKTVLDGLEAVRAALEQALARPRDERQALASVARRAAEDALDAFREKPSRVGRARIFGDRSIGLDDPGMVALARALRAIEDVAP